MNNTNIDLAFITLTQQILERRARMKASMEFKGRNSNLPY
jgi:hypothetical protein